MKRLLFLIILLFPERTTVCQTPPSTDYPYLRHVSCFCNISHDSLNGYFHYSYRLKNGSDSRGDIWLFEIGISRSRTSIQYDTTGLQFPSGGVYERFFRNDYPSRSDMIIPVGFPLLPLHWSALIAHTGVVSFDKDTSYVSPGESTESITMMSKGLPGIRSLLVRPDFNVYRFFPEEGDTVNAMSASEQDSIRTAVDYHGYAVGPWAPAAEFAPLPFLDSLTSFVTGSRSLGWITTQQIADKYMAYFNTARSALQSANIVVARSTLQTVLTEANIDSTSTLTSEAYALIRYNTEYLLAQLQASPRVKGG